MPNPPAPPVPGSLLSSTVIDSLSTTPAGTSNSVGSLLLAKSSSTTNTSTVAAIVAAAAAAAASLNGQSMQRHPTASAVQSSQVLMAHSNGIGGGKSGNILLGSQHQRHPLSSTTFQSQQPPSTHVTAATAIAAAVAAAAAAVAQQQQPANYRHQHSFALTSAATSTACQQQVTGFKTPKAQVVSKLQETVGENRAPPARKQSLSAMSNTAITSNLGTSSIPSNSALPGGGVECETTVRTIAATVGATSTIATLASPVPSAMLLSTSSSFGSSNGGANDNLSTINHSHRIATVGLSPSSSSSTAGGGYASPSSTLLLPMITKTQSNEFYINSNGSTDGEVTNSSGMNNVAVVQQVVTTVAESMVVDTEPSIRLDSPSFMLGQVVTDKVIKDGEEIGSCEAGGACRKRHILKHKLSYQDDDEHEPSMVTAAKIRLSELPIMHPLTETVMDITGKGGDVQHKPNDASSDTIVMCTGNGANAESSPSTSPTERSKNNIYL